MTGRGLELLAGAGRGSCWRTRAAGRLELLCGGRGLWARRTRAAVDVEMDRKRDAREEK